MAAAATHPFRETKSLDADPSMMFMLVHFVVERWREALLWSWVVGKHGGTEDTWTMDIMSSAWAELGGDVFQMNNARLKVKAGRRGTVDPDRVSANLKASGHHEDDGTTYLFCKSILVPFPRRC